MKTRIFEIEQTVLPSGETSYRLSHGDHCIGDYEFWEDACDVLSRLLAKTDKEVYYT